jgi:hypothetical protein
LNGEPFRTGIVRPLDGHSALGGRKGAMLDSIHRKLMNHQPKWLNNKRRNRWLALQG